MAWPAAAHAQVELSPVGTFNAPRHVTAPPADYERVFVVEGGGTIRLVKNGAALPDPFLDISAEVAQIGEGGLLSMALAPDYAASGRFYVFYSAVNGGTEACQDSAVDGNLCPPIRVEEYRRSAADPDRADPATARLLLEIPHERFRNHYGGQLAFTPDGNLYIGTGDGGGSGDPEGNSRNLDSLLGKLLRIDPSGDAQGEYAIPSGNPFAGATPGADEIWAYGLRNPYRFSFDRQAGDLYVGDVGQSTWEELDRVPAGSAPPFDFGWDVCEGAHVFPATVPASPCSTGLAPMFEYAHDQPPCSGTVISGFVVRDPGLESLLGRFLYADFCKDYANSLAVPPAPGDPLPLFDDVEAPVSFGEDACGRVYLVQNGGAVSRLDDGSQAPCPPPDPGGGGGGGGGGAGGGAGEASDLLPPVLALGGPTRQRLGPRGLLVRVSCGERCRVRVLASFALPGASRTVRFREVRRPLAANAVYSLRLKLSRAQRRRLRRALLDGRRIRAKVVVRARDDSGNLRVASRRVRLVLD